MFTFFVCFLLNTLIFFYLFTLGCMVSINIFIISIFRCWSYVGKQNGAGQDLSLQSPGCLRKDIIMHEFMHALGFWHEQSRPDRDEFVRILWENIIPSKMATLFCNEVDL